MRAHRRGLVVYQLLLILLGLALLLWLIVTLVNRGDEPEPAVPVEPAVVDTAPVPVPPTDSAPNRDSITP